MADQTARPEYAPAFSIQAEGQDITRVLQECLSELTLTDYGGATAKADELKISLISETLALPTKGARLQVALGFNEQLIDKGWFVVSGVSSGGPPRRIELYATAAPMNAQKQPGDVTSQKTRSWDNLRLADIVKTVATDNGLIPRVNIWINNRINEAKTWVNQNFITGVKRGAQSSMVMDGGLVEAPSGCVLTGGNGNESNQVGIALYRPLQVWRNGGWVTIGD